MSESCCPPGSHPYLQATHEAKGAVVEHNGVSMYATKPAAKPSAAVIIAPDVWGWSGGRVRAIADSLADAGYLCVVPKLLAPGLDGGTDGDALPPDGAFSMDWIKGFPWPVQAPKCAAVLEYVKSQEGVAKIGVFGFCYGGHPCCWMSKEHAADITCGVVAHPSMQLEQFAFGGDLDALTRGVNCPFLMLPAGNDMETFGPETKFAEALKASARGADCLIKPYVDMAHGWVPRGDLSDAKVARDVAAAMDDALAWFKKFLG